MFGLYFLFILNGCTVYTEKQSEAASKNIYATRDSINAARIDLADFYINEATKFIKPPKNPIKINTIFDNSGTTSNKPTDKKSTNSSQNRVVIVPDKYKNSKVVIVGSSEYSQLLKDNENAKKIAEDNRIKEIQISENQKEIEKQKEMSNKMVVDLNLMQKKLVQKDLTILRLYVTLAISWAIFIVAAYLRLKGVL